MRKHARDDGDQDKDAAEMRDGFMENFSNVYACMGQQDALEQEEQMVE